MYKRQLSIDPDLMSASGIAPWERVQVVDLTNGARIETYAIEYEPGSGEIHINGPPANLIHPGNKVIIMTYKALEEEEIGSHEPIIIHLDDENKIIHLE